MSFVRDTGDFIFGRGAHHAPSVNRSGLIRNTDTEDQHSHHTVHTPNSPDQFLDSFTNTADMPSDATPNATTSNGSMSNAPTSHYNGAMELSYTERFTGDGSLPINDFLKSVMYGVSSRSNLVEGTPEFEAECFKSARAKCDFRNNHALANIFRIIDNMPEDMKTWDILCKYMRNTFNKTRQNSHLAFSVAMYADLPSYKLDDVIQFVDNLTQHLLSWARCPGNSEGWSSEFIDPRSMNDRLKFFAITALCAKVEEAYRLPLVTKLEKGELLDLAHIFSDFMSSKQTTATTQTLSVGHDQSRYTHNKPRDNGGYRGGQPNRTYQHQHSATQRNTQPRRYEDQMKINQASKYEDQLRDYRSPTGSPAKSKTTGNTATWWPYRGMCFKCLGNNHTMNECNQRPACPIHQHVRNHTWMECMALKNRRDEIYEFVEGGFKYTSKIFLAISGGGTPHTNAVQISE